MKIIITLAQQRYHVNTDFSYSLAIALDFQQSENQPCHFSAAPALAKPMQASGFIGDTTQGGSCNVFELSFNPHCNGTHTETINHICHQDSALANSIATLELPPFIPCVLISVSPIAANETSDRYSPNLKINDTVISRQQLEQLLTPYQDQQLQALVVRTMPNSANKCQAHYSAANQPAFFTRDAVLYLNERGVEHLILDLPSLDRLNDDGLLTCHHEFWQVDEGAHQLNCTSLVNKTITEMAYINNNIIDGFYFLNLQTPAFVNDAAPSRPLLFQAQQIN
jgi:kynurenine formamidase